MKKVIMKFNTDKQAETFFGILSDVPFDDIEKGDNIKKALGEIMGICDIGSLATIENKGNYYVELS